MNKAFSLVLLLPLAGCTPSASGTGPSGGGSGIVVRLPAELRNDAYDYYGLGSDKPMRLEFVAAEGAAPAYGSRTLTLKEVKDGKAIYLQHHTDALKTEGDITLSLDKTGLYVVASTQGKLTPSLEIPAKLEVGGTWNDHTDMDQQGQTIKLDNVLKIERKERVATPGGTFDDALYVTSTGKGKLGDQNVTLVTKHWYVRGLGPVKEVVEVHPDKGPSRTITIQLAGAPKPGDSGGNPPMGVEELSGAGTPPTPPTAPTAPTPAGAPR